MSGVAFGLIAVLVGITLCFRGYLTMRIVIPLWGAFSGFALGAGLVAEITDRRFLGTIMGWLVGFVLAAIFAALAYLYFEVSVAMGMMAIGFILGTSAMVALQVTWTWVIVLVGVLAGGLAAAVAIASDLPMVILTVLTAMAGSSATVGGLMLLTGVFEIEELNQGSVTANVQDTPVWWVMYAALAIAGIVIQTRALESLSQTIRNEWESERRGSAAEA